jgi:hypothetical protein
VRASDQGGRTSGKGVGCLCGALIELRAPVPLGPLYLGELTVHSLATGIPPGNSVLVFGAAWASGRRGALFNLLHFDKGDAVPHPGDRAADTAVFGLVPPPPPPTSSSPWSSGAKVGRANVTAIPWALPEGFQILSSHPCASATSPSGTLPGALCQSFSVHLGPHMEGGELVCSSCWFVFKDTASDRK